MYFAYVLSYKNDVNIAWAKSHNTELNLLSSQQKHTCRSALHEYKFTNIKPLSKQLNALKVFARRLYLWNLWVSKFEN